MMKSEEDIRKRLESVNESRKTAEEFKIPLTKATLDGLIVGLEWVLND